MSDHEESWAVGQEATEGKPIGGLQVGGRCRQARADVMRIALDAPEAGEMFEGRDNSGAAQPLRIGLRDITDDCRVGTDGAAGR